MTTPQELFDKMPSVFNAARAQGINTTVQVNLTGQNGGTWSIKIADGACTILPQAVPDPKLTLTLDAADYVSLVKGELPAMTAFMQGKIKLTGDMSLAMKFQNLFNM